ncbi:MAG: helix-turn-helix transcriptional regulator [Myxococcales bacterium]|nr:helix-turn-helix transcriptional regulator [Myxococcales bacterium]
MTEQAIIEAAEGLFHLDPVRGYAQRAAELVAKLVGASAFRLEQDSSGEHVESEPPPPAGQIPSLSLPLRQGREQSGTLHLFLADPSQSLDEEQTRLARWGARMLSRGLDYAERLAEEGSRRSGEDVAQTLSRAPLTPRERDVVALLVSGASTRDIAGRTGLTVSTVNTYLKRIFSKLGVHSRVELVARMAGTTNGAAAYHGSRTPPRASAGEDSQPLV